MIIERVPVSVVKVAAYNPRVDLRPGDPEYDRLQRSIDRWDAVEPLVWNRLSGNLVGGHQRLKILIARGDTEVDVSVVELGPDDEAALNLALNNISGKWDDRKLFDLLSDLDGRHVDLTLAGFEPGALADLARSLEASPALFTPAAGDDLVNVPVTRADIAQEQQKQLTRFQVVRAGRAVPVMCPSCGCEFDFERGKED